MILSHKPMKKISGLAHEPTKKQTSKNTLKFNQKVMKTKMLKFKIVVAHLIQRIRCAATILKLISDITLKITSDFQIEHTMCMLSRNKIKNPEEQKLGEGGDDK